MDEESRISRLMARTRKYPFYAVLLFGIGYCLIMLGYFVILADNFLFLAATGHALSYSFFVGGAILGILFGITAIKSSTKVLHQLKAEDESEPLNKDNRPESTKAHEPIIDVISASVYVYSLMLVVMEIGDISLTAEFFGALAPELIPMLVTPFLFIIVGAVLLPIGFRFYRDQASKLKPLGVLIMMASMILIYRMGWSWSGFTRTRMLLSAGYFEVFSLLIAIMGGLAFSLRSPAKEFRRPAIGFILSISGLAFSIGVLYFFFWFFLTINYRWPQWSLITLFRLNYVTGLDISSALMMNCSWWPVVIGILLVGISGIFAFVKASISAIDSAKQSYMAYKKEKAARTSSEEL